MEIYNNTIIVVSMTCILILIDIAHYEFNLQNYNACIENNLQ